MAFPACTFEPVGTSFIAWCVGVAQKISAKVQATRVPMLSPFSLSVFVSSFLHYHICMFFLFPLCVPSDLKIGYEKSILTRTETLSLTTCFKEPLLFITLFLKRNCFYLLFICY